jgi:hypothetical protein
MNPAFEKGQSVKAWNGRFYDLGVIKSVLRFDEREQDWRYLIRFRSGYDGDISEIFVHPVEVGRVATPEN